MRGRPAPKTCVRAMVRPCAPRKRPRWEGSAILLRSTPGRGAKRAPEKAKLAEARKIGQVDAGESGWWTERTKSETAESS